MARRRAIRAAEISIALDGIWSFHRLTVGSFPGQLLCIHVGPIIKHSSKEAYRIQQFMLMSFLTIWLYFLVVFHSMRIAKLIYRNAAEAPRRFPATMAVSDALKALSVAWRSCSEMSSNFKTEVDEPATGPSISAASCLGPNPAPSIAAPSCSWMLSNMFAPSMASRYHSQTSS